uniref:DUF1106 domain-containing protein n=1 Tax=Escherichia coli TaxID=562 RepID=UPI000F0AB10B
LRGIDLTITSSNATIYQAITLNPNNKNHIFLYHKKNYICDKLKEIFPDEPIEFSIEYEN